jgi:glycosyltransferase involved in cell wall biosynthesis
MTRDHSAALMSLVIPVYRNEASLPELLEALGRVQARLRSRLEVLFVVDGSPDGSVQVLQRLLPDQGFASHLIALSRNFGSFAAIRAGLAQARGDLFAVMAADLQEPPELLVEFERALADGNADVVVGTRRNRADTLATRVLARAFWSLYRRFVHHELPPRGVDVFACNRAFRDQLVALPEANTSLVGLIYWLGFARAEVAYDRAPRRHGRSAWSLPRRFRYSLDSAFAFSDLPIRLMELVGALGLLLAIALGMVVLYAKLSGSIPIPGYAATVLVIMFFGALNALGLGVIGEYVWRAYENGKGRPGFVVARHTRFDPATERPE